VRRFGAQAVRRMGLGGEVFAARQAFELGLVDRLVDTGAGMTEATGWAEKIAARAPLAIEAAKMLINMAEGEETSHGAEALASGFVAMTSDLKTGAAAFSRKQSPVFERK
jgi:enoyl-CoA hydratase